jgi:chromosome segregation ATPase
VGVERAVTRWFARRQQLQQEIATLQARFEQLQSGDESLATTELLEVEQQLAEAQARLRSFGPCPKPMMG